MTLYEEQAKLEPHDGIFSEYNSLIINLGYVVLVAPSIYIYIYICTYVYTYSSTCTYTYAYAYA